MRNAVAPNRSRPQGTRPAAGGWDGGAERPRILFVGEAVSLAHVGRPALLARWAREAGYEVAFACGPAFASAAREEGLAPIPLETIGLDTFHQRLGRGRFFYPREELDAYVAAERALLARFRPDLVVGDFRLTLSLTARMAGVPMLALTNAHWSPGHVCPFPAPRAGLFKRLPLQLREGLFELARPLGFRLFARPLDDLRRRHGLPPLGDLRQLYTDGDFCAYPDLPELTRLRWTPAGHFFLGPLTWKPRATEPVNLDGLNRSHPLAYVSMGSSGDENSLPHVLRALSETGFNIVLSGIEPNRARSWRRTIPELAGRLVAVRRMDPDPALRRASVTVCHGGSGTVYQSLACGVPVLCVPHNPDQGLVARSVEAAGVGRMIHPDQVRLDRVRKMLIEHFTHRDGPMARRATDLLMLMHAWDTRARWLRWLSAFSQRYAGEPFRSKALPATERPGTPVLCGP